MRHLGPIDGDWTPSSVELVAMELILMDYHRKRTAGCRRVSIDRGNLEAANGRARCK